MAKPSKEELDKARKAFEEGISEAENPRDAIAAASAAALMDAIRDDLYPDSPS